MIKAKMLSLAAALILSLSLVAAPSASISTLQYPAQLKLRTK